MAFLQGLGGGGGLGDGLIRIGADTSSLRGQVRQGVQGVKQELNAGAKDISRRGSAWGSAFKVIGQAARIGLMGVAAVVAGAAAEAIGFEKAFAGVRKSVQGTPKELDALRKGFIAMSQEIPQSAGALAAIGETAGALGIRTKDIMGFTKVVALIGSTTNVSTDQAATALGQLANILGLRAKDFNRFGSALVYLGINGASTESQILEIASRSGAAGKLIGFSANQTLAWGSAVASLGIEVEAGGSSLQNFYLKAQKLINSPGGLKVLAKTAGMTGAEFKALFGRDSSAALTAFIKGLSKLSSSDQLKALDSIGLSNIRIQRTLLGLAGNTDLLTNSLTDSQKAWKENTALQDVAAKRFDTTAARLTLLKNRVVALLIGLGDMLLPTINALVKSLTDDLPKATQFLADLWSKVLYPPVSKLVGVIGDLLGTFGQIFSSGGQATTGGSIIATALTGIANAAGTVVSMLAGILGGLNGLLQNPIAQWAVRIATAFLALRVAIGLGGEAVRRLSGAGGALVRFASFGKLGGGGGASATPLDASAARLDGAAVALKESAAALKGAGAAMGLNILEGAGPVQAMSMTGGAAARARARFDAMSKAEQLAFMGSNAPYAGKGPGPGGGGPAEPRKGIRGAIGGLGGLISKAFWPLLIADIGTELIKAPLGDFISSNTQFKRVGAQLKEDFWGGMGSLVKAWGAGTDAFVGHADTMTIGNMVFNTLSLAKLGITSATFDKLEAPIGTIAHAQGTEEAGKTLSGELAQRSGEAMVDWWVRIRNSLPEATRKAAQDYIDKAQNSATGFTAANQAAFTALLGADTRTIIGDLQGATRDEYLAALSETLQGRGYTIGTIHALKTPQLSAVAKMLADDTSGKFGFVADFLIDDAVRQVKPDKAAKPSKHPLRRAGNAPGGLAATIALLESDTEKARAAIENYYKTIPEVARHALDQFVAKAGTLSPATVAKLRKKFGDDWMTAFRNGTTSITGKPVDKAVVTDMVRVFGPKWRAALQGFGNLLFLKEGGADTAALKKALAGAISAAVGRLGDADLAGHGKGQTGKAQAGIIKYLNSTAGEAALAAANSPDAKTAKGALDDLGRHLKGAIPDASKRAQFIGLMVSLKNAAGAQLGDAAKFISALDNVGIPTVLERTAAALDSLATAALRFLTNTGNSATPPTKSPPGKNRRYEGASGLMFDTAGTTDLTVGEVGRERVLVLRAPRSLRIPDATRFMGGLALPGVRAPEGGGGGHHQTLYVDHMHVQSASDERSILDTLAFMAPAGV